MAGPLKSPAASLAVLLESPCLGELFNSNSEPTEQKSMHDLHGLVGYEAMVDNL
jgi:hypothetical protein